MNIYLTLYSGSCCCTKRLTVLQESANLSETFDFTKEDVAPDLAFNEAPFVILEKKKKDDDDDD